MRYLWVALLLLLNTPLGWTQKAEAVNGIAIDLGWVGAVQQNRGWLVTSAPPAPPCLQAIEN